MDMNIIFSLLLLIILLKHRFDNTYKNSKRILLRIKCTADIFMNVI